MKSLQTLCCNQLALDVVISCIVSNSYTSIPYVIREIVKKHYTNLSRVGVCIYDDLNISTHILNMESISSILKVTSDVSSYKGSCYDRHIQMSQNPKYSIDINKMVTSFIEGIIHNHSSKLFYSRRYPELEIEINILQKTHTFFVNYKNTKETEKTIKDIALLIKHLIC